MKKIISIVLVLVLVISVMPSVALAAPEEAEALQQEEIASEQDIVEDTVTETDGNADGGAQEHPEVPLDDGTEDIRPLEPNDPPQLRVGDLAVVDNLTATAVNHSSIKLTWDAVENATGYSIARSLKKGSGYEVVGVLTSLEFVDKTVVTGTTYFYTIAPMLEEESGVVSQPVSAKAELTKLAGLKATHTYNSIKLTWNKVAGADQYYIYRSDAATGKYALLAQLGNVAAYTDKGLGLKERYYYKVEPCKGAYKGFQAGPVSARTALFKLENLKAKRATYNAIHLTCDKVPGATNYYVYRADSPDGKYKLVVQLGNVNEYRDKGLNTGKPYYYKVKPYRKSVAGSYSASATATPTLSKIKGVAAKRKGYNTITLSWEKLSGANRYFVYRSTDGKKYELVTKLGNVTSYNDVGITTGQIYYYKIRPYRDSAKGDYSDAVSEWTVLAKPKNLTVARVDYQSVRLAWSKVTGATQYRVYRAESEKGTYKLVATVKNATEYVDTELQTGKFYYYKVRAKRGTYEGGSSAAVEQRTVLSKFATFSATRAADDQIRLRWTKIAGANKYEIYRSDTVDGTYTLITTVGDKASYVDANLAINRTYYYRIRAYRDTFKGTLSGKISASTAIVIQGLKATATGADGNIKLTWNAIDGAGGFIIQRAESAKGPWAQIKQAGGTATSYTDKGRVAGKTYYYQVIPMYSDGTLSEATEVIVAAKASAAKNIQAFIDVAYAQLGKPYSIGGKGPDRFDCSGLVWYCLKESGMNIPYMTSTQWCSADFQTITNKADLRPGDIICRPGHVEIYVGDGMVIDASTSNGKMVYRAQSWNGAAKRVF